MRSLRLCLWRRLSPKPLTLGFKCVYVAGCCLPALLTHDSFPDGLACSTSGIIHIRYSNSQISLQTFLYSSYHSRNICISYWCKRHFFLGLGSRCDKQCHPGRGCIPSCCDGGGSRRKEHVVFYHSCTEINLTALNTVTGEAPWAVRVAEIKASAAINLDAERKVTQLNEELQGLVRAIRTRVSLLN